MLSSRPVARSLWSANQSRGQHRWSGVGLALEAVFVMAIVSSCLTLPGHVAAPEYTPRIVDREYKVVWETLLAALRNEGAQVVVRDPERGVIDTTYRARPGTKVVGRGILGVRETRLPLAEVRYNVRARPVGPEKTEVRLRTLLQYLDTGTQQWVPAADDGSLKEDFWRRFEHDLAYYGARPDTWRPDALRPTPVPPAAGTVEALPGAPPPGSEVR